MKPLVNRRFVIAVLAVACLMAVLLTVTPIRSGSPGPGEYDPWLDWNDDSEIDIKDVSRVAKAFGTSGQNITKGGLLYDSNWVDLAAETSQTFTLTHNLNLSSVDMIVDARQRTQTWNKTYGGADGDRADALIRTSDGGYALAGGSKSYGAGLYDVYLVKTDLDGNMQWNKTYEGTTDSSALSLIQTSDGGYALTGWIGPADSNGNVYLVRTDAHGNMQWNKTYGGTGDSWANSLVQTSDGGYAIAGNTNSFGAGSYDVYLVKTDAEGNIQWNQTYGGTGNDRVHALVQTGDGGYTLAGWTTSFGAGGSTAYLIKTDENGNMEWYGTYGGENSASHGMIQTIDGGYALASFTLYYGAGWGDFYLVKTDANGVMLWNMTYGGTDWDGAYDLVQTSDGGYALAGYTWSFGAGGYDVYFLKTDLNGNISVEGRGEFGLAWATPTMNTITLVKDGAVPWSLVRVQIWKKR